MLTKLTCWGEGYKYSKTYASILLQVNKGLCLGGGTNILAGKITYEDMTQKRLSVKSYHNCM